MENANPPPLLTFDKLERFAGDKGDEELCKNCVHWVPQPDAKGMNLRNPPQGICFFNPPQVFLIGMASQIQGAPGAPVFATARPQTAAEEFCGHFEAGDE